MRFAPRLSFIFILFAISSCATMFSGTEDKISFTSNPEKAKVYMDTRYLGETPLQITVPRIGWATANQNTFRIEKKGYKPQEFKLTTKFNTTATFNTVSLVSWLVDALSGAVTQYSPTEYHILLEPANSAYNRKELQKSFTVQSYILSNFDELLMNVAKREGEHIANLQTLLRIDDDKKEAFVDLLASPQLARKSPPQYLIELDRLMSESDQFGQKIIL